MRRIDPALLLIGSFAGLIAVGTALLSLPVSWAGGRSIGVIDALFTATSAVCVTGLITLDTARAWSPFGQAVILGLIQVGGLGLLTFATFFMLLFGRPLSLSQRGVLARSHGKLTRVEVRGLLIRIVTYALTIEAVGAVILAGFFARDAGLASGIWQGAFHAVSGFCNAGFSLFSTNLEAYAGSWVVNLTIMALVVLGGISFIVITDVEAWLRRRRRLALHSKVVLATTAVLIAGAAAIFYAFEYRNVLDGRPRSEALLITLFQSVTPRTAGFNTVPYGELTNATLMLTLILMFVGGSPGSTAGGVKTSTVAILFGVLRSRARGMRHATLFRRSVPEPVVGEAIAIVLLSVLLVMGMTFALQWTELRHLAHPGVRGEFLSLNFEAVSAFGTVGLSMGETPGLKSASKIVIVLLMFIGRLGPLTLALALGRRRRVDYYYAEEAVLVG
ncbi:MAG TPA: TrkH family potassium uptake protein [Gemmatimonadota bacterium]|nr:TrkH family potassium uptake protein [Gemmatimonadota bacterium]